MLGFCYVNPGTAVILANHKLYVSELIENDTPQEMAQIEKFLKRAAKDTRQKVIWVIGTTTLRRVMQEWPAEKVADVMFGVFDAPEKLVDEPNVKIVDCKVTAHTVESKLHNVWKMHPIDFDKVMTGHPLGYELPSDETAEQAETRAVSQKAKTKAKPVVEAENVVTPEAPVKLTPSFIKSPPADSLPALFDVMLGAIENEKKRAKASSWIACRIEGAFSGKEEWDAALTKITQYGVDAELVRGAIRMYKTRSHLERVRLAVKAVVVEGEDLSEAAKKTGARAIDLEWLDAKWPFKSLTPEVFGGA